MKTSALTETMAILRKAREQSDSILVSFSGGKDSLVVLDVAVRTFKRVETFFMTFVPGLRCVEDPVIAAAAKFNVPVHMYPHWAGLRALKQGIYCFNGSERDEWPDVKLRDIYATVIGDTGIPLIATGAKRTDSLWRKRHLDSTKGWTEVINPIVGWSKHEVIAYLVSKNIPVPKGDSGDGSGIDLSMPSVLWLHDNHPEDFQRLLEWFPLAQVIIERRRMYGEA